MTYLFNSNVNTASFLENYWQKKPLLIKNAVDTNLLQTPPDELAGLSLEEDIESRLISQASDGQFHLAHGPFHDETFTQLDSNPWTLLVQGTEHWLDESAQLLAQCRFIPSWRLDDVMISFATPGGGVGPHLDSYDVFLIQGIGKRRWRVGQVHDPDIKAFYNNDIKQILPFKSIMDVTVETGDLLYLPANTAHEGIALTDCTTYSIGFRYPSFEEVSEHFISTVIESVEQKHFQFTDSRVNSSDLLSITDTELNRIKTAFFKHFNKKQVFEQAFLQAATTSSACTTSSPNIDNVDDLKNTRLITNSTARFAATRKDRGYQLSINGELFYCSSSFFQWLNDALKAPQWTQKLDSPEDLALLLHLVNNSFLVEPDDSTQ